MDNSQEWQTSSTLRRFPWAEIDRTAHDSIADEDLRNFERELFLDLRLFLSAWEEVDVTIAYMEYTGTASDDTWEIIVAAKSGATTVFHTIGVERRLDPGTSDVGKKRYAYGTSQGVNQVLTFIPGPAWDDTTILGGVAGDPFVIDFTALSEDERGLSQIHPTNVNTDIRGFRGFYLTAPYYDSNGDEVISDEAIPDEREMPDVTFNRFQAGYNIQLGASGDELSIDLVAGAGEGLYPCEDADCKPQVRFINGVAPNEDGNVTFEFYDCLRHSALNEVDESFNPVTNGIKVYSDCLPCCACDDYNNVSRAMSRMSAKFKDVNKEMNSMLRYAQESYDEAIELINEQSPGLAIVHSIEVLPASICLYVMNVSNLPIYAALSIDLPDGSDIVVSPGQSHVLSGIVTTNPPLTGLSSSEQDSGIVDLNDVEGWRNLDLDLTVGGEGGGPILPAAISKVCIYSPSATAILDSLSTICANLQVYFGGPEGTQLLSEDATYQGLITELEAVDIASDDCLDGTDFTGLPSEESDRFRCRVETTAEQLTKQEIRDKMLSRKYELAFDVEICGVNALTANMSTLISGLAAIDSHLPDECKDGSFSCPSSPATGSCESEMDSDPCQSAIRNQALLRAGLYSDIADSLRSQVDQINDMIDTCLDDGMIVDQMANLDTSTSAIYGSLNFACRASNKNFEIGRREFGSGYECLDRIFSIISLTTGT